MESDDRGNAILEKKIMSAFAVEADMITPDQIRAEAIDDAAMEIHDEWQNVPGWTAWVRNGNSHMQMRARLIAFAVVAAYEKAMWRPIEEAPKGYLLQVAWLNTSGNKRMTFARYYFAGSLEAFDRDDADENGYAPEGWYEDPGEREEIYRWEPPAGALWRWPDYSLLPQPPASEVKP